jgi:multidrug efflux pump subunit AcrB
MEAWFFRNPRGFALAILVVLAMGWSAWLTIGRQEDPTITNLFGTVLAPYPGAEPARVEGLVTEKIEAELRSVAAIAEIASVSRTGLSVITVELVETLPKDAIEDAWNEVRRALDDAADLLPADAGTPRLETDASGTFTAITALSQRPGDPADPALLARMAADLADRLRLLPGTETVEVFGAAAEEILVEVDPAALAALGLDAAAVSARIAAADAKVRAGRLQAGPTELLIEVSGAIGDLERIRAIPLAADAGGALVRLGDIARVRRAPLDPPASLAHVDGRPAVLVAARAEPDLRIDRWAARLRGAADEAAAELPAGVELRLIFDQSRYTAERFAELGRNIALGVGLVAAVLLVTLGWRAAVVVATTLPLAGLISLFAMQQAGISLHQMSVTGMIVALGLLVDAAIVTTDAIQRRIAAGVARAEAVARSVRGLTVPLAASTLTTVLAFAPMALLPGAIGDFVGSIAKSVIIMLTASLLLALTLTPALAGWILPAPGDHPARWWRDGIAAPRLARGFARSIEASLANPGLSILVALALPVTGFLAFPTLTAQFFPGADRDQFHVQITLAGSPSIHVTDRVAAEADAILRGTEGVTGVAWVVGESAPGFYYNMIQDQDGNPAFAEALVTTASPAATRRLMPALQARLDADLPAAQALVRELVQGPPVGAPVEIRFVGRDLETLRALGDRTRALMAEVPGITHSRASLAGGAPKLVLELDEDRVALAGLDLGAVAGQLTAGLDGALGGSLVEGTTESPVRVRLDAAARAAAGGLAGLDVLLPGAPGAAAAGAYPAVPLTALGTLTLAPQESPIHRLDGERINLVQAFTATDVLPEEALGDLAARLAAEPDFLPPGVRLEIGGDADARSDTVDALLATIGLVVVLTLATLVLGFGSFRLTLIALLVCVLASGLSFLALAVFRYPFGIQALIGVIGSIGVSINAAIIVLTALMRDAAARAGDRAAMRDVVTASARHIVSTTVTTFGGFLPLILAGGGFWPPFAMAVAGGVLLSAVVSFYFTPPMFALLMRPRRPRRSADTERSAPPVNCGGVTGRGGGAMA